MNLVDAVRAATVSPTSRRIRRAAWDAGWSVQIPVLTSSSLTQLTYTDARHFIPSLSAVLADDWEVLE